MNDIYYNFHPRATLGTINVLKKSMLVNRALALGPTYFKLC